MLSEMSITIARARDTCATAAFLFNRAMLQRLFERIESKTDELVALTRELIRFPTVNPPGDAYVPCAELIGTRLALRHGAGFVRVAFIAVVAALIAKTGWDAFVR